MSEARNALLAMPGVDPSLLPQGWVENHYRSVCVSEAMLSAGSPLLEFVIIMKACLNFQHKKLAKTYTLILKNHIS